MWWTCIAASRRPSAIPSITRCSSRSFRNWWPVPLSARASSLPITTSGRLPVSEEKLRGVLWILLGLAKKMALADQFAQIADSYFQNLAAHPGAPAAWSGVGAFAMQIFFDFSGYTDMAIGMALLLGFHFPTNFRRPYLAFSITDFWHRWHISLSRWLRDYLYIPLGGNRHGSLMTYRNLMLTMLLGGLWHGASWNFVIWGGYHGRCSAWNVCSAASIFRSRRTGWCIRSARRLPSY